MIHTYSRTLVIAGIVLCLFSSVFAKYSGGSGESNDPYKIANVSDLLALGADANDYSKAFILVNDINLAEYTFSKALIARDGMTFNGIFDGDKHSIISLKINTNGPYLGLFGNIGSDGIVNNLCIEDVNIIGPESSCIGGLCGWNDGRITNCYSTGNVTGSYTTGGLCGWNNGRITNCYSTSNVSGYNFTGTLCGVNAGRITNCYSTGNVTGIYSTGGLCGRNLYSIINCYSTDNVSGNDQTGGLCGVNSGTIANCYFLDTAGPDNGFGEPLTGEQMKDRGSFANWDFWGENADGTSSYWIIKSNSYPQLYFFDDTFMPYEFDGQGTAAEPYLIYNANDLGAIWQKPFSCYKLVNDVNLDGIRWFVAVIPYFNGSFDGDNHIISNLSISGISYLGLFGEINSEGILKNIGIEDVNITGTGNAIGGLYGWNFGGSITNCYSAGNVTGDSSIGGLCGGNDDGNISSCYSTVLVKGGFDSTGGLCGENHNGSIANCYSTGLVTGGCEIGGLCGSSSGSITNCYSTGLVTGNCGIGGLCGAGSSNIIIINSYFLDTAGPDNSLGEPLTDEQMKQQASFIGWDFVGETVNGTEDIWQMRTDVPDYPHLRNEYAYAHYSGGSGTAAAPYRIAIVSDWQQLMNASSHWHKHFIMTADINLQGVVLSPVGNSNTKFTGVFDGNGHIIRNVDINSPASDYIGLFGYVDSNGLIRNLGVEEVNIIGSSYVGGLAGKNNGTISNCYADSSITGYSRIGGLVGGNRSRVNACYATGTVVSYDGSSYCIGGLAGYNLGDIATCYSTGAVSGTSSVGGLAGYNAGSISDCYSTGSVSGTYSLGGLLGSNDGGSVVSSFWDVNTSGQTTSAGGEGKTTAEMQTLSTYTNAG
ncbi:MAG: GLUG motif-containing protein [Sedimentisphaerales bacterium]